MTSQSASVSESGSSFLATATLSTSATCFSSLCALNVSNTVQAISSHICPLYDFGSIAEDCKFLLSTLSHVRVVFSPRSMNVVALC